MELAIWRVHQPSRPCLKMYWEHFPGSYSNQFKAEVSSLSFIFRLCRRMLSGSLAFCLSLSGCPSPQKGQEPGLGQGDPRGWSKAGPLSSQTTPPGSQAQLPGPQSERGFGFRICQCLEFSRSHVFCQAKSTALPTRHLAQLNGTVIARDLRHMEGKEQCIHFFLKIMGKITTPVAENWDPYQVNMKEIMTEAKDKCSALFRASENFPWCGSPAGVGSDNYSWDTHTLSGRNSCFHHTLQSVFLHLISLEPPNKPVRRVGPVWLFSFGEKGKQVHRGKIICFQTQREETSIANLPFWGFYHFRSSGMRPKIILPRVWPWLLEEDELCTWFFLCFPVSVLFRVLEGQREWFPSFSFPANEYNTRI